MGHYCCFFDPENDYTEKKITDLCPKCGKPYDYVLTNIPKLIGKKGKIYTIEKSIARGFYGATFLCNVQKRFKTERVLLKIIPTKVYDFFGKNFEKECQTHAALSENTEHLVHISDAFESKVNFGSEVIDCHIAELEYIDGITLSEYLENEKCGPKSFAQIAIDLLEMWNELIQKETYHNDLHMGNLMVEFLDDSIQRVDEIDDRIRLRAIDLNSANNLNLSNYDKDRFGDRKYIASHLEYLSKNLREKYQSVYDISDSDHRLIQTLDRIVQILSTNAFMTDYPTTSELIRMIKDSCRSNQSYSPWKTNTSLSTLSDGFNAQTIPTWVIPKLLVDPDNKWISEISKLGPQLITGMRGCGKTMLLNSIDVHARLREKEKEEEFKTDDKKYVIDDDKFVGLSASCKYLLDINDISNEGISKLILIYTIQSIRAIRHMRDIGYADIDKDFHAKIADTLSQIFDISFDAEIRYSDISFERFISDNLNRIGDFCKKHKLQMHSIASFEALADTFLSASDKLLGKKVLFLLDDASTRYLQIDRIYELLTKLVFMSEKCAFKISTEMQTLYSFKSPGFIEKAQENRDYQLFDLGEYVYQKTRDPKEGKKFIEEILSKRLKECYGTEEIPTDLSKVLGDCTLESIAKNIIMSPAKRKAAYYGATALAAICVGDIGDIILLYEAILSSNTKQTYPIDHSIQTKCYLSLCSKKKFPLETKTESLCPYIDAFSEASYRCLMESKKDLTKKRGRVRQYDRLFLRMTDNIEESKIALRKLIDAGIFVYADGNGLPRMKSSTPTPQIKLAFRKLFGLQNYIGLGSSDRFELSGESVSEWLQNPTKELLLKNIGVNNESDYISTEEMEGKEELDSDASALKSILGDNDQISLFDFLTDTSDKGKPSTEFTLDVTDRIEINDEIYEKNYDIGIFGLGFEERTLESVKRIISEHTFDLVVLIQYEEEGESSAIKKCFKNHNNVVVVHFEKVDKLLKILEKKESVLIDVTGLYKPIIFEVIRKVLINKRKITVVYTEAEKYYPLNDDIEPYLRNVSTDDYSKAFISLMKQLTTGETNEYTYISIVQDDTRDIIRPTVLLGFVSPKNQRLFAVLDRKEYNAICLFIPEGDSSRDILSRTAGNIAAMNYQSVELVTFDIKNPHSVLLKLADEYEKYYVNGDYNFELALTGSKMQAVAAAAFSSVYRISQCWYVKPKQFDTEHFTKGVGTTKHYEIIRK